MTAAPFRPSAIIPSHNHWQYLPAMLERLRALGLPVFVIDDGSGEPAAAALAALHAPGCGVQVTRLATNRGKGAAVLAGFALARTAGFTHAVQLDADGQHDIAAVDEMLAVARRSPEAVVAGQAMYDRSAPLGRVAGRWITHACVWLETLSLDIRDSMCGLRVYPLAAVEALLDGGTRIGERMDFDTDILVRLHWLGTPVVSHPVRVIYPEGNLSNFRLWHDNWHIAKMHTRLILGMLARLPRLAFRRSTPVASKHWSGLAERGIYGGLRFSALAYRLLGRRGCMVILAPVVLYFYLTAGERRRASLDFLRRAFATAGAKGTPGWRHGYFHFLSFARRALDSFTAWIGRLPATAIVPRDTAVLDAAAAQSRGALFIVSHHGNVDVSRASLDAETRSRVVVLMHTRHAESYNRILREFNPAAAVNTLQVTEIGPETAIALQQRIDAGDWLFIAGDRTPVGGGRRTSMAPFFGEPAEFSQGPYLMAALLDCPVYLFFCRRAGDCYELRVETFAERIVLPRGKRIEALSAYASAYAARLEKHVLEDPYQWYNFYDFWRPPLPVAHP